MKIKIKEGASNHAYHSERPGRRLRNYSSMIRELEGEWLEVETKHLFTDQYNTVPVPGVSDLGLRIGEILIEKIEEDVRLDMNVCNKCNKITKETTCCNGLKTISFKESQIIRWEPKYYFKGFQGKSFTINRIDYGKSIIENWETSTNKANRYAFEDENIESTIYEDYNISLRAFLQNIKSDLMEHFSCIGIEHTETTTDMDGDCLVIGIPVHVFNTLHKTELINFSVEHICVETETVKMKKKIKW